jgi:hypothetical protein
MQWKSHLFVESTVLILYEIYDFSFNQSLVSIVNIFCSEFYSMNATGYGCAKNAKISGEIHEKNTQDAMINQ